MDNFFKLSKNNTNVRTEFFAGLTTFMTMAYILIVNPNILSATGMDKGALLTATAAAAIVGTLIMGLYANYPFALAPGMGLNAFFAFSVVGVLVDSWQQALTAILIEGIIFLLLTFFKIREMLFNAIPVNLKYAVSAGIGLFIAFIGMQNAGIIVKNNDTLVSLGNLSSPPVLIALIGVLIISILLVLKIKGAILIGIISTWSIGIIAELTGWYTVNIEANAFSVIPDGIISSIPDISPIAFKCFDFSVISNANFWVVVFAFLFVDLFDTLGTLIGVSSKAGFLDKDKKLPRIKKALFADSAATTVGAVLGTSTTTTYVESASGVANGGRTGLTSVFTALFFFIAMFFSPILLTIPSFATAPALIVVGFFMIDSFSKINFSDPSEGIPAFITAVMMPLAYSISEGIMFGIISFTVIKLLSKKSNFIKVLTGKDSELHIIMFILSILFILRYILI
jgi:AGZA family xanthine/uracil permease-like MFS transporter